MHTTKTLQRVCFIVLFSSWPFKKLLPCLGIVFFPLLFIPAEGSAQTLDSTQQPVVWLRADSGVVASTLWQDMTRYNRHATAVAGEGPVKDAVFNYNPALTFDGSYMKIPYSLEGLREITIMAVFQTADTTERGIWGAENALSRKSLLTTRHAAGPDSSLDHYGKNERFAVLSTVQQSWDQSLTLSPTAYLALGSAGKLKSYAPFKGRLAEILVFDKRLDGVTRQQWETYLAIKYGIAVKEGNYVGTGEQVVWDAEANKEYAYRIAGLGRDTTLGLHQKQAKSAFDSAGLLTMSVGNLATTNQANTAVIPHGDYLVWGDNGDSLLTTATGHPNETLAMINRKWLMNVTGNRVSQIPTQVRFNVKSLPRHEKGYWLAIDRSGEGAFVIDRLHYIAADSMTRDSIAVFNNVAWDTDHTGTDGFTLVQSKSLFALLTVDTPTCKDPLAGKAAIKVLAGKAPFSYDLSNTATGKRFTGTHASNTDTLVVKSLGVGDYVLRLKDAAGTEVTRTFTFSYPNTLLVDLGPDKELTAGQELVLDATRLIPPATSASYHWQSSYGFSSTEGKIKVTESGIYTVKVMNAEGCVFTDEVIVKGAQQQRFEVFPSFTSNGRFNISVSLPQAGEVVVGIYDLKGNKVGEMRGKNNQEFHFYGQVLHPGVYMVVLHTAKGTETKKIIAIK